MPVPLTATAIRGLFVVAGWTTVMACASAPPAGDPLGSSPGAAAPAASAPAVAAPTPVAPIAPASPPSSQLVTAAADSAYDIVIRNGRVLDGAGNPWILADVA